MSRYTKTMMDALADVYEKFESRGYTTKQVKMAIGIASDPRYKQGNYTGAVKQIEKIKKGLSDHPQVAAVLKRQNTDFNPELEEEVEQVEETKVLDNMSQLPKGMERPLKSMQQVKKDADLGGMKITHTVKNKQGNKVVAAVVSDGKKNFVYVNNKGVAPLKEEVELDEEMRVFRVSSGKLQGNVHAKDEKEAEKIFRKKGAKGKITITDRGPVSKRIRRNVRSEFELDELDEGKMKAVAMKIDSIVAKMKKNKEMKSFADKFKKEASKTLDIAKSLEKVLPDYIAGKDIAALVKEETIVESWELDEMKMDDPKLLKIFDKLKKGSTVKIKIDSSISKGKDYREFTVTAKNIVGKGKKFEQEKITLKAKDNPTGVKHFLYNRNGKVTLAIGDMGASIADIKENRMSAYTAAITKGVK